MLRADAMMNAPQPRLEIAEHQVDDGQIILSQCRIPMHGDRHMTIAHAGQPIVAPPCIGHNLGTRLDRRLNKSAQCFGRPITDGFEPNAASLSALPSWDITSTTGLAATNFHSGDNKGLVMDATAKAARLAADPNLINLDMVARISTDPITVWPHHPGPQLVEQLERGLVALEAKLFLELDGGHAGRVGGDEVGTPKPDREPGMAVLHDRAGHDPVVFLAFAADEDVRSSLEPIGFTGLTAPQAMEAIGPADRL